VKCLLWYKLFSDPIFIVNLARSLSDIDLRFRYGS
jgi:hypothetical protein